MPPKSMRKNSKSLPFPYREPRAVRSRQEIPDRMAFREQTEMHTQSMGDGVWLSVIKGQRMIVRSEWAHCNDASSRVAPQIILSRQTSVFAGIFYFRAGRKDRQNET